MKAEIKLYTSGGVYTFKAETAPEWREDGRVLAFRGGQMGDARRRDFTISLGDGDTVIVSEETPDS